MKILEEIANNYQFEMKEYSNEEIYNKTTSRKSSPKIHEVNEALELISSLKEIDCYFFQKIKEETSDEKI